MNKKRISLLLIILVVFATGGFLLIRSEKDKASNHADAKDAYYCPMHKEYVSDKPGNCPICSMKLVKKEKGDKAGTKKVPEGESTALPHIHGGVPQAQQMSDGDSGNIYIPPERQQALGVRSVPAERKQISREIRTVGKISYDETRIAHIHTKFNGWVEEVFVDFVGESVRKGQPLFTIYSPELVSTQEEYLLAIRSQEKLGKTPYDWIAKGSGTLVEAARARLQLWGISDREIDEIVKTGKTRRALTIYSPVGGVVTQRAAYHHGMYVTPEAEIYTIVDLSTIWLLADIYEKDLPLVRTGQNVQVDFPYGENPPLNAKIDFFYPYLDPNTRTGQVRIQFKNTNQKFKPDQFVNVVLRTQEEERVVVPSDAVLNTGEKQYVFVDLGDGYFEPREVRMGIESNDRTAIESGLKEGERIVTAANFLMDSEARLKGALENMGKPSQPQTMQQEHANNLSIVILEPKTAKTGDNHFRVSIHDSSGKPINGADVEISLSMPQMGSMPPMKTNAVLLDQENGNYGGTVNVPMAWTWETTIVVKKNGAVLGSSKTTVTAR
jgi:multidrug efflux pump subunit AcrA (membrane-fusion protein)